MERVKTGERYYHVKFDGDVKVDYDIECGYQLETLQYECGNYFHTKEEAVACAEKIKKVLLESHEEEQRKEVEK